MRIPALALVLLLACSCGGGGGDGPPLPADVPSQGETNLERTRAILEDCTLEDLDRFLTILDLLAGATDPDAPGPDLQIEGINIVAATVSWALDVDRDGAVDMRGTVRFEDAQGNPTLPFDLADLLGGLDDLASLLASIQDGTTVILAFHSVPDEAVDGEVEFTMLGGVPTALAGTVTITSPDCVVELELQDTGDGAAGGTFPEAVAHGTVISTSGDVEGTVTFDGTSRVLLDMTIDGDDEVYSFVYDLETGELTESA